MGWLEIERRFRELEAPMKGAVLDYQSDDLGWEDWTLRGGVAPTKVSFEALADIAGALLSTTAIEHLPQHVVGAPDNRTRWYRALWYMTGPHERPVDATEHLNGRLLRNLRLGHIWTPAAFSAAVCLKVQSGIVVPGPRVFPADPPRRRSVISWLESERERRGVMWVVLEGVSTLLLAAAALVVGVLGLRFVAKAPGDMSSSGIHSPSRDSASAVRAERTVQVAAVQERWQLVWLTPPAPACTPETGRDDWMTCPCDGFAFGEQGHLALTRRRRNQPDESLVLDKYFDAVVSRPGVAVLQRWPVIDSDLAAPMSAERERRVRARPAANPMIIADYDHDGRASEFTLKVGNSACGHDEVVAVGVSRRHPELHVFGTGAHPNVPLVLQSGDWDALRRSKGRVTVVEIACGDHGSDQQLELRLDPRPDGIRADSVAYSCTGPNSSRGLRLFSKAF